MVEQGANVMDKQWVKRLNDLQLVGEVECSILGYHDVCQ